MTEPYDPSTPRTPTFAIRPGPTRERLNSLDLLKATAIVAVIGIHVAPDFSHTWGQKLFRFAVPAFLAVSGFLYYSPTPIPAATIRRRLRRALVPYLVVSGPALLYAAAHPGHSSSQSVLGRILFGASFGPYYYVFVLCEFILATILLSRLQPRGVLIVFATAALTTAISEVLAPDPPGFWVMRSPHLWGSWFLAGWLAAAHRESVFTFVKRYSAPLLAGWLVTLALWSALFRLGVFSDNLNRGAAAIMIVVNMVGLLTLGQRLHRMPRSIRLLSDWSYPLYLLHPFFIYAFRDIVEPVAALPPALLFPLRWFVGFLGALALTAVLRKCLGTRSPDLIGA